MLQFQIFEAIKKNGEYFMKILCSILFTSVFVLSISAQTNINEPLSWKGVTIDVSNYDDVITKFGKPEKEEIGRLDILNTKGNVFTLKANNKEWKILRYKEIEQAQKVQLGFNQDNKLVFIQFKPPTKDKKKLIDVQSFLKTYKNVDFKQNRGGLDYILFGKLESGYILTEINRGLILQIYEKKDIENESADALQGWVWTVQFISKSLENDDNIDVLK